jgi:ribosomal protein S18 acetylase RimI-like enzyme
VPVHVRPVPVEQTRALRRSVLRPTQTEQELGAHESPDAFAVGVDDGGALIAVGFIMPEGGPGAWRIRGMATEPHARGRGAGRAVLDALLRHAARNAAARVWCNARTPARSFYERAGFRVVSEEFELPGIGPHVVMERQAPTSRPSSQPA